MMEREIRLVVFKRFTETLKETTTTTKKRISNLPFGQLGIFINIYFRTQNVTEWTKHRMKT